MPLPSVIAIDGPGASGKSTVGRILARKLGYRFIDTGEMYRALTWLALDRRVDLSDEGMLARLAADARIEVAGQDGKGYNAVFVNGLDVTSEIRSPRVEAGVSQLSKVAGVRQALVAQQRSLAEGGRVIMAGRDVGTVVVPRAGLKVFLLASAEERARRRHEEQGDDATQTYQSILAELRRRDQIDSQRSLSPLRPAEDAWTIDTEGLTPEQVAERITNLAEGG
jgi:cytidylate kinase